RVGGTGGPLPGARERGPLGRTAARRPAAGVSACRRARRARCRGRRGGGLVSRPATAAFVAAFHREVAANRLNRFLHVHLALAGIAGLLPLFTPGDAAGAAPWWVLQATLYCLSLSTLLLGLSSAHGETDEFPLLFAQ